MPPRAEHRFGSCSAIWAAHYRSASSPSASAWPFWRVARDGMAGTGLALFTASWATFGVQDLLARPGTSNPVLGLYLIAFAVVVALLGAVAVRGQPLLALILLTSAVRTALAGSYEVGGPKPLFAAAAIMALVITLLAFYGAVALLLEDTSHRTLLPLGRRGQARTSLHLDARLRDINAEAGVRRSL